jgi:archaellum biogenesis protein FlaJ (TadC family)
LSYDLENSLENSKIEKLWALNQQLGKILVVLVVTVPYVRFIAPMAFYVLSTLTPKALHWPNFGHCCFGQVPIIRCDMIFWEFYGK